MDMSQDVKSPLEMSRNYHDMGSINSLKQAAKSGDKAALQEAAQQFESIFVQMMLKSMRKAQDAMADKDSPFNSEQVKFYRDMHDQQLATDLSSNGSIGLAKIIVQQMSHGEDGVTPASAVRTDGNLLGINRQRSHAVKQGQQLVLGESKANVNMQASKQAAFDSPKAFLTSLYNDAVEVAKSLNIDPKALLAQAAVETGWGKHMIHNAEGNNSHNLFGIKADKRWDGDKTVVDTLEFVNNLPERQQASFRAYQGFKQSMHDYVDFVKSSPRYQKAVDQAPEPKKYFSELQQAGYATDPSYAQKVMSVYNSDVMAEFRP